MGNSGRSIHTKLEPSFQPGFRERRIASIATLDKMPTGLTNVLWQTLPCKHLNYTAHTPLLVNVTMGALNY